MSLYAQDDSAESRWHDAEPEPESDGRCECGALACAYDAETDRELCVDCRGDVRVRLDAHRRREL